MNQDNLFTRYNGALLYVGLPHQNIKIDKKALKRQIIETKSLFARYMSESQLILPPRTMPVRHPRANSITPPNDAQCGDTDSENYIDIHWWHCLRVDPVDLDSFSSKQRYRIKKGLKLNNIKRVEGNIIISNLDDVTDMLQASFSDYPDVYKPQIDNKKLAISYAQDDRDKWLIFESETNKIIGLAICSVKDGAVGLNVVKVNPDFLKNEVNAALVYELCRYYLNDKKYRYICDGERNIMHITNYQDFLVRVLGFKKVPCKLHVVYHPAILPIIILLYPFRKIIGRFKMKHSLIYKLHSVLMQEEIARHFK